MRLIKLSANKSTFKTIFFNKKGLSLIVGGYSSTKKDRSNGVGKTLALEILHFCLGSKSIGKKLQKALKDWVFSLTFEVDKNIYTVQRSVETGKFSIEGPGIKKEDVGLNEYLNFLKNLNIFEFPQNISFISFRSLFKRFARVERDDCKNPVKLSQEKDYQALVNTLWLLGLDVILAYKKYEVKQELDNITIFKKTIRSDPYLQEIIKQGIDPHAKAYQLKEEIEKIRKDLENLQIADDYYELVKEADELTKKLRKLEIQKSSLELRLTRINSLLKETPDISKEVLKKLYGNLYNIFKPEVLRHFEEVEKFQKELYKDRISRLSQEKIETEEELNFIKSKLKEFQQKRDNLLQQLKGKTSFEEYRSLLNRVVQLEEQLKVLEKYQDIEKQLQEKEVILNKKFAEILEQASDYLKNIEEVLLFYDEKYREFAKALFEKISAGIQIKLNTGKNRLLYDLGVNIEGQSSDGINAARILCFDWLIFNFGKRHGMEFLWHDNRLFSDLERKARAYWFKLVIRYLNKTGKQYIATLNQENYETMLDYFTSDERELIEKAVILRLGANRPEDKLLGIQFDL